ncbi:MAG: diguanylate cyclase [Pseudomonadota bacterium]
MTVSPLATLLELSPLPMLVTNASGIVNQANESAGMIFGLAADRLQGNTLPQLLAQVADDAGDLEALQSQSFPRELCIQRPDGVQGFIELSCKSLDMKALGMDGTSASIVIITDITARKKAEIALREIEHRLQTYNASNLPAGEEHSSLHGAFHNAPIGMMLVDLDWQITRVNRSICDMLGYRDDELLARTFQDITHPEDISTDLDLVRRMIAGDINDYRLEKRYFHKDGHVIWMLLSVSLLKDSNNIPVHFIFHILDITEYKKAQQQISEYAYQDALTNLPNRRLLQDRLKHALMHAKRYKRRMGIMFLDIDYFKAINDTYGHAFGDELIKTVADRLSLCVRSSDTVCRLGGDEFVIVISEINNENDAAVIAEKILQGVSKPIEIEGHEAQVTMSIGIVIYDADADDTTDSLMKKADQSLYEMKREGRNGYRIYKGA